MPAPKPPRKLLVLPNPYFSLGPQGQLCGAVRADIRNVRRWIGAKLQVRVNSSAMVAGVVEVSDQDNWFEFSAEQVSIEDTRDHRQAIADGHLIACDAWSAHRACFPHQRVEFIDPAAALAKAREGALKQWLENHDDPPEFLANEEQKPSAKTPPAKGA